MSRERSRKKWLVPEVVQTSAMDCGPAALKAILEGFGVPISYGRLREACQTDVDGTSIDTLEEIAVQLGMGAEQEMIPIEHLLLDPEATLPAIVVTRLPNGMTHFVVAWSATGGRVQVMDPSTGRRWPTREQFLDTVYKHLTYAPSEDFRAWAGTDDFLNPLRRRLARIGAPLDGAEEIERALEDPGARSISALDAGVRLVESLLRSDGLTAGPEAVRLLHVLLERSRTLKRGEPEAISPRCWFAHIAPPKPEPEEEDVRMHGAVVVKIRGPSGAPVVDEEISPDLAAALAEPSDHSLRVLLRTLREDGLFKPFVLSLAVGLAACAVIVEALLYWGLTQIGGQLFLPEHRLAGASVLIVFLALLLAFEVPLATSLLETGRALEVRLRVAFLEKIPRLADRYFSSRPVSDMAQRSHTAHALRGIPALGAQALRACAGVIVTTAALILLDPPSALAAVALAVLSVVLPVVVNRALIERDLRVRTHAGALGRFYLDALLGLLPIRAHTAERAVRREHEGLLGEWVISGRTMLRAAVAGQSIYGFLGQAAAAGLLIQHLAHSGAHPRALLIAYWAFALLGRGQELGTALFQYPAQRNISLRLLEMLGAPNDEGNEAETSPPPIAADRSVELAFEGVRVNAGGHAILEDVDLEIAAGSHVAIVGPSGAGKSSLVGLLLGWHRAAAGRVLVDGEPLLGGTLDRLRSETAWVDPAVQLWNRSFLENLQYGSSTTGETAEVMADAELFELLERLPHGQQTVLGEGGALVSGGEGQRVRLGRAMLRAKARLVLLDEPFRGLDREKRRRLLERARKRWARSTLLCVTHDVGETLGFERVLVVEGGKVVEDGAPAELQQDAGSRYRALLDAEEMVQRTIWSDGQWRHLTVDAGRVTEAGVGDD